METINLNAHPQILDLYEALEQNGLHKQKEEVQSLVGYIENMEYSLSVMMSEIQEMHSEVNRLQNKGVRAKCAQIVTKAEDKIQQAKTMVSITKVRLIQSAENAVKSFKEKGKSALVQAVAAMRIPAVLSSMKNGLSYAAESMRQSAGRIDSIRAELHEVGGHMKNAGRALLGKSARPSPKLEADKGILAKLRNFMDSCGKAFSKMEKNADNLLGKIQRDKTPEQQKPSVKSELNKLKTGLSEKSKMPLAKEQAR